MRNTSRFPFTLALALLFSTSLAAAQKAPVNCPVSFVSFNPSGVSVHIHNTSGKEIVGLSFYAALADATEHWKWYHWNFDENRPLREFGWNKEIKPNATKGLSWSFSDINSEHGSGGAFVLTSVLFADGTSWEDRPDATSCMVTWLNSHKKAFTRPIELPAHR